MVMHSELDTLEDLLVRSNVTLKLIAMATKLVQSFENFDSHLIVKQTSFQTSTHPFMYTVQEEPNLNIKFGKKKIWMHKTSMVPQIKSGHCALRSKQQI